MNKALKALAASTNYHNKDWTAFPRGKRIVVKKTNRARRALDKALSRGEG